MVRLVDTKTEQIELISDHPIGERLGIYLDVWKQFFSRTFKTLLLLVACLVAIEVASAFLTVGTIVGAFGTVLVFFKGLIFDHPFLALISLVAIVLFGRVAYGRLVAK